MKQSLTGDQPKLKEVFKVLLPLASEWKSIGTLLGLPEHRLRQINSDEEGVNNRLREMVSQWLKQVHLPTWNDLADAVDCVDKLQAEEIRKHCVDI